MDTLTDEAAARAKVEDLALRCLQNHSYPGLRNIGCEFLNGVLILRGFVATYYLKQLAQAAVSCLDGVGSIDNQIQVLTIVSRRD